VDEIILVDRGSRDQSADLVRYQFPGVIVVQSRRDLGLGKSQNEGIRRSNGDMILLLHAEVQLDHNYIERLVAAMNAAGSPRLGSASGKVFKMFGGAGLLDAAGLVFDHHAVSPTKRGEGTSKNGEFEKDEIVFGPSPGAALYFRRTIEDAAVRHEFLDEDIDWLDEIDLAWRTQLRGWQSLYVPRATAISDSREGSSVTAQARVCERSAGYLQIYKNLRRFDMAGRFYGFLLREVSRQAKNLLFSPSEAWTLPSTLLRLPTMRRKRQIVQKRRRIRNALLTTVGYASPK